MFERDADPKFRDGLTDEETYAKLKPPSSIVVKFGRMKLVGEYPYRGDAKPGCGSKMVVRTFRAIEFAEMLTTTCGNSGCGKSISRSEMLTYVENSGGRDYPFQTNGEILRVATIEDLNRASAATDRSRAELGHVREIAAEQRFPAKIVDLEFTFDESLLLVYYLCDERIDFRDLTMRLANEYHCRIEMRQVGARDEARLVADYERCGQHCCCKNFLKVLKPISMRSAKVQKATLDPMKISGRCGRLMCCLRYEDATYEELRKKLPKNKTRVGTSEGPGIVVDSKILVQLVLVRLDAPDGEYGREIAVPVEELMDPNDCPAPGSAEAKKMAPDPMRGMSTRTVQEKLTTERNAKLAKQDRYREKDGAINPESKSSRTDAPRTNAAPSGANTGANTVANTGATSPANTPEGSGAGSSAGTDGAKKKRRRKRKKSGGSPDGAAPSSNTSPNSMNPSARENAADSADSDDVSDEGDDNARDDAGIESSGTGDSSTKAPGNNAGGRKRRRRRRRGGGGNDAPRDGGPPAPTN